MSRLVTKFETPKMKAKIPLAVAQVWLPVLLFLSLLVTTVSGIGGVFYANHLRLKRAILYSELERTAAVIAFGYQRELHEFVEPVPGNPTFRWTEKGLTPTEGAVENIDNWEAMEKSFRTTQPRLLIDGGQAYIARASHIKGSKNWSHEKSFEAALQLTPVNLRGLISLPKTPTTATAVYVVSNSGQLIITNNSGLNEKNYIRRPIVQKFIASKLQEGSHDYLTDRGQKTTGYYFQIQGTDLVLFAETLHASLVSDFFSYVKRSVWIAVCSSLGLVLLMAIFYSRVLGHLFDLTQAMEKLSHIPSESSLRRTKIREIAVLQEVFQLLEKRTRSLYKARSEQESDPAKEADLEKAEPNANAS